MKNIIFLLVAALVMGCEPGEPKNVVGDFILPPELKDCQVFELDGRYRNLYVVRCPNSYTSTAWSESCGKNCSRTISVAAVEEGNGT